MPQEEELSQKELFKISLRPGNRVDLVLKREEDRELVIVRHSLLHQVLEDGRLILAQTAPPVPQVMVARPMEVTFLARIRKGTGYYWIRTGYFTRLLDIIKDFKLGPGYRETVLLVGPPARLNETNLRMHFRFPTPTGVEMHIMPKETRGTMDRDLEDFARQARQDLYQGGFSPDTLLASWTERLKVIIDKVALAQKPQTTNVLDVSPAGAKLSHPLEVFFPPGSRMDMVLVWEDHRIEMSARVIRVGELENSSTVNSQFTSVQFLDMTPDAREDLRRMLVQMSRRQLAKRSGLAG